MNLHNQYPAPRSRPRQKIISNNTGTRRLPPLSVTLKTLNAGTNRANRAPGEKIAVALFGVADCPDIERILAKDPGSDANMCGEISPGSCRAQIAGMRVYSGEHEEIGPSVPGKAA